ncbi:forkhead domain-containing protein [Purpureocillium lavendulum]|uniref:Forkhead domain-containing protein n=1 Tax=Purpureocillium lavendulum TaxID=1247861 RepID=A0AB34FX30_9HYPO|nr:forkhead domain-containing protein [Purpureocillium lavendulum]
MTSSSDGRDGAHHHLEAAPEREPLAATTEATQRDPASSSALAQAVAPASNDPAAATAPATTTGAVETAAQPVATPAAPAAAAAAAAAASPSSSRQPDSSAHPIPDVAQALQPVASTAPAQPSTPPPNRSAGAVSDRPSTPRAPASGKLNPSRGDTSVDEPMPDAPISTPGNPADAVSHEKAQAQAQGQVQQQQQQQAANMHSRNDDQYPPSTPFTPAAMANLDQQAYMMMALMSGAQNAMSPPPTVTPAQVTLPNPMDSELNGFAMNNNLRQGAADKGLESFARIEFADSVFQMTTYAVIIGRDQRALEQARRDEKRAEEHKRRIEENASKGLPPPSPIKQDRSKFSKSYVSEEGGMLGPESDSEENGRPTKRRKTSTTGSSQKDNDESQENMISNRQYVSHTPGAAAVDLTSLRPSPWHVPFIGIHSPGPDIASKTKAISREHLRIAYNQKEGVFEAIPLHKNGFFCEDIHYKSDKVVLHCGDRLQIKDVDFRFIINGVERGCTGAEEYKEQEPAKKRKAHGGKEMSFDFEQSHGNGEIQDTSDELSEVEGSLPELSDFGEDAEADDADEPAAEVEDVVEEPTPEVKPEPVPVPVPEEPVIPQIPKKRGPGRPPKNGVMSKREQRLLKKQQQEMAKKTLPQAPPVEPPVKRKVGRPRKHPLPENAGDRPEKRKYKPRKPKTEDGAEGSDAERRAREKKEKKVRPKSPPLELKIEDYTEEQLQKPNKNYGVLIDETLTAAGPDGLTLKQIYKRICQRYPWFYFHTETKGWESSVRHNLIGNEAFKKDETTNLWSRVPGVELDAGKKRKATSPDRALAAQGFGPYTYPYNAAQHLPPGAPGFPPGQTPHGYQMPQFPGQPGQPPRPMQPYGASASPPTGPAPVAAAQPPPPAHVPGYGPPPAPARPQLGGPQPGTYSSPYASRPPPPASAPVKTEEGGAGAPSGAAAQPPPAAPAPVAVAPTTSGPKPVAGPAPPAQPAVASASRASATSATPPANAPPRPVIDPRLLTAVVGLKNGLVENLKKARNPKAEAIVMSALNRCIGLKTAATENDKMEAICIKGIRQVIEGFTKKKNPTPGDAASQSDVPLIFEAKVLSSLTGFKDVSIKALSARLGEARAEAVTLSSIDRVLGLADASILAPPAEGEQGGNFEGVEQHLMKSLGFLLRGMNQQLQDPK